MKLAKIVSWYQKKIGTYDKQQWEKTVEQRILNGFIHIPLKNTRLKTELIDVDLVRGSSFPKAKPKQGFMTVLKLSVCRFLFLPLHAKWWVEQTSPNLFLFLLMLYLLQMINWGIYSYNIQKTTESEHIVSITELLIPMAISMILCMIHSQIVATSSVAAGHASSSKRKGARCSQKNRRTNRGKIRRKKKIISRPTESKMANIRHVAVNNQSIQLSNSSSGDVQQISYNDLDHSIKSNLTVNILDQHDCNEDIISVPSCSSRIYDNDKSPSGLRKRNVNWDLSTRKSPTTDDGSTCSSSNNGSSQVLVSRKNSVRQSNIRLNSNENQVNAVNTTRGIGGNVASGGGVAGGGDDDGFESFNGKSSSGEENTLQIPESTASTPIVAESNSLLNEEQSSQQGVNMVNQHNAMKQTVDTQHDIQSSQSHLPASGKIYFKNNFNKKCAKQMDSTDTDEEGDDDVDGAFSSPTMNNSHLTEATTSATEWIGITTNSEDCSYSSELDHSATHNENSDNCGEFEFAPTVILNPICGNSDRINCTIWDGRETKKAEMSVLDISSAIIERVEAMPESCDYVYIGIALSLMLSSITAICRLCEATINSTNSEINILDMPVILLEKASVSTSTMVQFAFGNSIWERAILMNSLFLRISLTTLFFFVLAVAEKTFKQRFLYAKLFSHLTSSRRARKSEVPHFRLNKVRNIKTWLSVRSYLMRRGPQRSVDVIVSAAFILTLLLLAFLSVEWLKDSVQLHLQFNLEALLWSCSIGCFMLRFMTLGTKINRKYRSISVLITEQINLYLQIEQKPQKKEELMVANSVLKLAADLLKELDSPFKISGLSANPYLYTTVKVVILSALSGVLSEILGFKLKLHKIKIK